jgi:hypothetical protein
MARIRSVKPELRTSQLVASWPFEVRYFWVLLWGYLDDRGRGLDLPKTIAGDCFPLDEKITGKTIDGWLTLMTSNVDGEPGPMCRYTVGGKTYIHAVNWSEHQRPNRPTPSRLPRCPLHDGLTDPDSEPFTNPLTESPRGDSRGRAAEQQSRGAGEQQQPRGEPPPAAAAVRLLLEALEPETPTRAEAEAIAARIQRDRRPKNLTGLLRTIAAAGELPALLADVRAQAERAAVAADIADARNDPDCPHGQPGGLRLHRTTGQPLCPQCRAERRTP